jgi:membrane peptidoglycan carboxypeptidase
MLRSAELAARAPGARRGGTRRFRRRLARVALCLLLVGLVASVGGGLLYLQSLPDVGDAQARVQAILAAHHGVAAGLPVPARVGRAIVAVEDARFYSNHGIDVLSVLHGAWGYVTTGSTQVAGATISEQLAKALYVPAPTTLAQKLEIPGLAFKLNQRYSKAEILDMYLNVIYYGDEQWGIVQASQAYFGKPPQDLDWAEASLLAGLPNAPSAYDPTRHFALAKARQRHVLDRLVATGALSAAQAAAAAAEPLSIRGAPAGPAH